jgi:tetratricopeptide (TPR) repeat protein
VAEPSYHRTSDNTRNLAQNDDFGMLLAGATGDYPLAERRGRASLESRSDPHNHKLTIRQLAQLALVRGRLAEGERYLRQSLAMSESEHNWTEYIEDAVLLGFLDIWFRRRPGQGIRVMDQALARHPLDSIKPLDRPYPMTALAYAMGGRPDRARALLTTFERLVKPDLRRGDEFARRLAWGEVAMAEGRFAEAIGEFQAFAAAPRVCLSCGLVALAQAYDRAGQPDSAIAVYTRYVTTPDLFRLWWALPLLSDGPQLAAAHKRLGELYEQQGDRQSAAAHYTRFVELWRECDPELRGAVSEVEQRLRRLGE